jgi:hypothetical protein
MNSGAAKIIDSPTTEAVATLLRGLIDYAGLFPPAALAMVPAVVNYQSYLKSQYSWILGRFIVPVGRLDEFDIAYKEACHVQGTKPEVKSPWTLSVLAGANVSADLAQIGEFNHCLTDSREVEIKSIEIKVASPGEVERLSAIIPAGLETYFEIPLSGNERDWIAAVANCGRRAKLRTGGETADKFPTSEGVIDFLWRCASANVPFKATAGLHHPLRSLHRFTYQPESASGIMHGFLNVLLAAGFLRLGMEPELALQVLNEQSAEAFLFDSDGVTWRDHRLGVRDIALARRDFLVSFGSCSFTEPVNDLRFLNLL